MKQVVIENPIINSPFDEPTRHFRFSDEGVTDEIVDGGRNSTYFTPIARPKKKAAKQLDLFDLDGPQERHENELINQIRGCVSLWRARGRSAHLEIRCRSRASQNRRESGLRSFRHTVLPARF